MAIVVTTNATQRDLETIVKLLQQEQSLTPRSLDSLQASTVAIARDGKQVVGWVVSEHLYGSVYELGAAYVLPAYRQKGLLSRLLDACRNDTATYVAALFSPQLVEYVCANKGFKATTLKHIIAVSHWRFITKRIKVGGRVAKHLSNQKALFVIRSAIV